MAHFSRLSRIVVDAPPDAHDAEIAFWSGALASPFNQVTRFPDFHWARLPGDGNAMLLQRLGDGSPRLHLDIHATDRAAEVTRLEQLGATVVDSSQEWTIMRDPAGLLFCVVPDASLDSTNANAWP
jgi:glyoxalase superfamily protein